MSGDSRIVGGVSDWKFLSNHTIALVCLTREPNLTLRQIGDRVGLTERATHRIVSDLVDQGYLTRTREGRRNRYEIQPNAKIQDPVIGGRRVGELLALLASDAESLRGSRE
jgi:predicted ArsR family transcriptional regulator